MLKSFPQWFNKANAILKAYENLNLKYVEWVEYEKLACKITGADMESYK